MPLSLSRLFQAKCAPYLFAAVFLTTLAQGAYAQVAVAPSLMNFQGRLTKPDGTPVADGTYSVRFSLWDAVSGGTEKWNQTIGTVTVKNGTFAVLLNTNTANLFAGDLYLEIKIGTDAPLTPRQQLVSVAYAMKANSVPDGSITSASIANGAITSDKLANDSLNNLSWLLTGNSGTNPASNFLGTKDNQPLVFRANNTEWMRLTSAGRLGIGTTTPVDPLTVVGSGTAISAIDGAVRSRFFSAASGGYAGTASNHSFILRTGDADRVTINTSGNVGIGTGTPGAKLHVNSTGHAIQVGDGTRLATNYLGDLGSGINGLFFGTITNHNLYFQTNNGIQTALLSNGNFGLGVLSPAAKLDVNGSAGIRANNTLEFGLGVAGKEVSAGKIGYQAFTAGALDIVGAGTTGSNRRIMFWNEGGATFNGNVGLGTASPAAKLDVIGTTRTQVLTITGGSDIAEPYDVSGDIAIEPGMVVTIDKKQIGKLRLATSAYDHAVAGIISGAGGVKPGMTLTQENTVADGKYPIAMSGRVWCYVDADANGPIEAGDLLTTSKTPGYAMKATDVLKSHGTVLGKAMSPLAKGKGLVLVLVNLH